METINRDPKTPKIFGLVTHQSLEKLLYDNGISKFLAGSIFGTDAAMITAFRKSKIPALVLYAECHPFFPDPEASIIAITTLAKILKVKVDTTDIQKKLKNTRTNLMITWRFCSLALRKDTGCYRVQGLCISISITGKYITARFY